MEGTARVTIALCLVAFVFRGASVGESPGSPWSRGGFAGQARAVLQRVRASRPQLQHMTRVVDDLQTVLQPLWPGSTVVQFGATATGLALKRSDVDCFVFIPHRSKIHANDTELVSEIQSVLTQHPNLFTKIHFKTHVNEVVLTFEYLPTKILVDLSVTGPLVIRDAAILSNLLNLDERIMKMAIIVKYWSYVHGLSGNVYVLPSYTFSLFVIFYLQQKGILPSIASLQKGEPLIVDHWNTAFDLSDHRVEFNQSLYELLGGFFKYYSEFNFDDVISSYCGCVLKRHQIVNLDLPEQLYSYKKNLKLGLARPFVFGPVNVQDIFELDLNVGRPWNGRSMLKKLVLKLKLAAETFESVSSDRFLLTILETKHKERDLLNTLW